MNINHENPLNPLQNVEEQSVEGVADKLQTTFETAHVKEEDAVAAAKDAVKAKVPFATPTSSVNAKQATVHELKSRLNWGEPGLTIVDVRDRNTFAECSIQGAMSMPLETLSETAQISLQPKRDIYVYGKDSAETAAAAASLRQVGFSQVAELLGGVEAWREIGGSVDGTSTDVAPKADAYNVVARLKEFAEERAKERQLNK